MPGTKALEHRQPCEYIRLLPYRPRLTGPSRQLVRQFVHLLVFNQGRKMQQHKKLHFIIFKCNSSCAADQPRHIARSFATVCREPLPSR